MEVTGIFKDSLNYPTKDWGKLAILGSLMILLAGLIFITVFSAIMRNFQLAIVLGVMALISGIITQLIYNGYGLAITKDAIENRQSIDNISSFPSFNLGENLVDGIKVFVLGIVYMIIPTLITVIFAYAIGLFNYDIINQYVAIFNGSYMSNPAAIESITKFSNLFQIVNVVNIILTLIFTFFLMIARARLAETSRLSSIFEIKEVFDTISKIGWGNYIIWYVLLMVIAYVIVLVGGLIAIIPIIGIIIFCLFVMPFVIVFEARALGLIYNESKND
jgi:hypothetical protein